MSKKCLQCKIEFTDADKFCNICGEKLTTSKFDYLICPECTSQYPIESRYCSEDGNRLISPSEFVRKCVKCYRTYENDVNFCPDDGGEVRPVFRFDQNDSPKIEPRNKSLFQNLFSFEGRIRRLEYGLSVIIYSVLATFLRVLIDINNDAFLIFLFFHIPLLWFLFAQGAKRSHDIGNSGWYQLIPLYGFLLLFQEGEMGSNEYGSNPKN